jgi:hypothetical protein
MKKYPKTIEEVVFGFENIETVEKLRDLIKDTLLEVEEKVKRGRITYVLKDKDFLRIDLTKSHVDLGFVNGTRISSMLLKRRGRGRSWRHLEVKTPKDVENPEIKRLILRAAELFQL